jgi:acetyltransferase-like isoleucine patch superfamily enzyme
MSFPGKSLSGLMPEGLKQALLRWRLRSRGVRVEFGAGARIDSYASFGVNATLGAGAAVFGCSVGRWTYFGEDCLAIYSEVGAFCSIAPHVIIGGGRHPTRGYVTTSPLFYSARSNPWGAFPGAIDRNQELPRTFIGNDVWIGYSAVVLPGIRVGDGAVIGAGSIVNRDVEPYQIVAGTPARTIRPRFDAADTEWLLEAKWWDWPDEELKRLRPMFSSVSRLRESKGARTEVTTGGAP